MIPGADTKPASELEFLRAAVDATRLLVLAVVPVVACIGIVRGSGGRGRARGRGRAAGGRLLAAPLAMAGAGAPGGGPLLADE